MNDAAETKKSKGPLLAITVSVSGGEKRTCVLQCGDTYNLHSRLAFNGEDLGKTYEIDIVNLGEPGEKE